MSFFELRPYDTGPSIWSKIETCFDIKISGRQIIMGGHNDNLDEIISIVSYSIYKYWLVCLNNNKLRSIENCQHTISAELFYKSKVYDYLGKHDLANNLLVASSHL